MMMMPAMASPADELHRAIERATAAGFLPPARGVCAWPRRGRSTGAQVGINRQLLARHRIQVKRADTSATRSATLGDNDELHHGNDQEHHDTDHLDCRRRPYCRRYR